MTRAPDDLGFELPPPATGSRIRVFIIIGVVSVGAFAYGYTKHRKTRDEAVVAETGIPCASRRSRPTR